MVDKPRTRSPLFPTTQWSLVDLACDGGETARHVALNQLLTRYWPALKAHLVFKKRIDPNEADDLVQGFIQCKVLERDFVSAADAERGRFRSFLATSLDNYFANQMQMKMAAKREADRAMSLDAEGGDHLGLTSGPPLDTFDVAWAREILTEILSRMRKECERSQRGDIWDIFERRIVEPILEGAEPTSYDTILARHGFRSPTQVSNVLVTGKRMFRRIMRKVVSEYADDEQDIDAEIQELQNILSRGNIRS